MPGISGKRFVSLVGMENENLLVDPPIGERNSLSFTELEKHWSGQGFLLWRDFLNLLRVYQWNPRENISKGFKAFWKRAGAYNKSLTGVYDSDTLSAIKQFQLSKGIGGDGIVGGQNTDGPLSFYRSVWSTKTHRRAKMSVILDALKNSIAKSYPGGAAWPISPSRDSQARSPPSRKKKLSLFCRHFTHGCCYCRHHLYCDGEFDFVSKSSLPPPGHPPRLSERVASAPVEFGSSVKCLPPRL